uniref:beta strand repeat-containing protein n=1 Tax=uncultured Lutibacter sp. TaxID=437739 RepID=UPI00262E2D24
MKKTTYSIILIITLLCISQKGHAQVFEFFTSTGMPNNTQETVDGITLSMSSPTGVNIYYGLGVWAATVAPTTSMTFSFSSPVNIASVTADDVNQNGDSNWIFTPTGGSNSVVNAVVGNTIEDINLNWTGVTSFVITRTVGTPFTFSLRKITLATSNETPTITGILTNIPVSDNSTVNPFSTITIADAEGDNISATIALEYDSHGVLSGTGLSGSGPYNISSTTPNDMQTKLRALTFNPTDNRSATSETTRFILTLNDGVNLKQDGSTTVVSSAVAPTVTSVTVPSNNTYTIGENLDFTVHFNESIIVTGIPQIDLTIGSIIHQAVYQSGSGTGDLVFRYIVQNSDIDNDGITIGTLKVNGGSLKDTGDKDATLTLNSVGSTTNVLVDALVPIVTSVNVPTDATYIATNNLDFTVNFDENIIVNTTGGIPQLNITIGSSTRQAVYQSGSGSNSLLFRYTIQLEELDTNGITIDMLDTNGGTLQNTSNKNASLTLNNIGNTTNILVDSSSPTITSVTVPTNATYTLSNNLDFTIHFNENIIVTGIPQLSITIGSTIRQAIYQSGSNSSDLTFRYIVQSGELDSDGIEVGTLTLNGGTLKDKVGNNATLTLNNIGITTSVLVNGVSPPIVSSISPPSGPTSGSTPVVITGANMLGTTSVMFGNIPAIEFTIDSPTQITATSPSELAGIVDVTVTTAGGTSATNSFSKYAYVAAPTISNISPSSGSTFGSTIVISGTNLSGATSVMFGSKPASNITFSPDTQQITASSPPNSAGLVNVTVTTAGGTSEISSSTKFNYVTSLYSQMVRIPRPDNWMVASHVFTDPGFNYTVRAADDFIVPANGWVVERLEVLGGYWNGAEGPADNFTVEIYENNAGLPGNLISSQSGLTYTETSLTFSIPLNNSIHLSEGHYWISIQAEMPFLVGGQYGWNLAVGPQKNYQLALKEEGGSWIFGVTDWTSASDITNEETAFGTVRSSYDLCFGLYGYVPAPIVTGITPSKGPISGSTPVIINGINLANATSVMFGNNPATTFIINSSTQITATSPSGLAGIVDITVTTPGGTSVINNSDKFTYIEPPIITSVSVPINATYIAEQYLDFAVSFNKDITVITSGGKPQLTLTIGSNKRQATYISGSSTDTLIFRYEIQPEEMDTDGITINTLITNGSVLTDEVNNNAVLTLNNVGTTSSILVDAKAPTVITQDSTILLDKDGIAVTEVAAINNGSFDSFGIETLTLSKTTFNCTSVGENSVTLTATDVNGNTASAEAVITVVDIT